MTSLLDIHSNLLTYDINQPPLDIPNDILTEMTMHIWKRLIIHDEILRARGLLNSVPFKIEKEPEILEMIKLTNGMLSHIDKSIGIQDNQPLSYIVHQLLIEEIEKFKSDTRLYLNIGITGEWFVKRVSSITQCTSYHKYDVQQINIPKNFPKEFDVISMLKAYECVKNPQELIKLAIEYMKTNGTLIIIIPHGKWERSIGQIWNDPKPRKYVRTPLLTEVVEDMMEAKFRNVIGREEINMGGYSGQDAIIVSGQK